MPVPLAKPSILTFGKTFSRDGGQYNLHSDLSSASLSKETQVVQSRLTDLINPISPGSLQGIADKTLEEKIFDATASVKILTAQVAMHLDAEWRSKLFKQLDALHDIEGWDDEDEPIQTASFSTFLKAIVEIKPNRRPALGLTHNGYLVAAWTVDKDRLTIEFLKADRVRWVLARSVDNETERFASQISVSRLTSSLAPYNPGRWFNT